MPTTMAAEESRTAVSGQVRAEGDCAAMAWAGVTAGGGDLVAAVSIISMITSPHDAMVVRLLPLDLIPHSGRTPA